ncbi:hypothetical protein H2201_004139 [Coniosporium apollinis]|uniref:Uncharacterized protein n=1 Tax=Coniosporium apollinis TaxID=61459 RepID=A0ABQ9NTB2_9PEZI|nr:hypothetical protein H2201_004139 [Coniosporium apollinis]
MQRALKEFLKQLSLKLKKTIVRLARVKFDSGNPYNLIRRGFVEGELQDAIMPSPNGPRDFLEGGLQGAIVAFQDGPMDILDMANGTKFRAIAEIELRWYGKGEEFDPKTYTSLFYVSESREARFDVVIGSETCAKEGLLTLNFPVGLPGFPGIRRNTPGPVPSEYRILHTSAFAQILMRFKEPDLKAAQHAQDQTRATEAALMKAHEQRKSQPPSYGSVLPKSVPGTGGSGGLSRS